MSKGKKEVKTYKFGSETPDYTLYLGYEKIQFVDGLFETQSKGLAKRINVALEGNVYPVYELIGDDTKEQLQAINSLNETLSANNQGTVAQGQEEKGEEKVNVPEKEAKKSRKRQK